MQQIKYILEAKEEKELVSVRFLDEFLIIQRSEVKIFGRKIQLYSVAVFRMYKIDLQVWSPTK